MTSSSNKSCRGLTTKDKEELIGRVFVRPSIWDKRLKSYSMRQVVDRCWEEIAMEMGVQERELRKKWKHLRDQFSVELKKSTQSSNQGSEPGTFTKWAHFESMMFLKDVVQPKPPSQTNNNTARKRSTTPKTRQDEEQTTEDDDAAASDEGRDEDFEELSNASVAEPICILKESRPTKKRRRGDGTFNEAEKAEDAFESSMFETGENDDLLFFRSLLPFVGRIPPHLKLKFRNQVQQIVHEFAFPTSDRTLKQSSLPTSSHSPP